MIKLHDTIAAIATPPGAGGIAIIRISGNAAEAAAARITKPISGKALSQLESHKLTLCDIHHLGKPERLIDRALAVVMRAPRSYTGETVVELQCHGGFLAADRILNQLLQAGARLAEAGEFTRRAFINGKTDLTGAEAVMDMIDAHSGLGLENAAHALDGALARKIDALRNQVMAAAAHVSAAADYPEEVDAPEAIVLLQEFTSIQEGIDCLLSGFDTGRMLKDGIVTVILGRPNVGKSSILNALARADRAIVTDIPGTTRDVIEEYIRLGGAALRLLDTAGIRTGADEVECIGIQRALEHAQKADLCLLVLDSTRCIEPEDLELAHKIKGKPTLVLLNKTDQSPIVTPKEAAELLKLPESAILKTAVPKEGDARGIDALEAAIRTLFIDNRVQPGQVYLSSQRQKDALLKAQQAMERAVDSVETEMPYDLLYIDLEDALAALGEVTGVTVQEEIVEQVFSRFCVGK